MKQINVTSGSFAGVDFQKGILSVEAPTKYALGSWSVTANANPSEGLMAAFVSQERAVVELDCNGQRKNGDAYLKSIDPVGVIEIVGTGALRRGPIGSR